eukprot:GHVT01039972.1.p1 GENE.GHVT01039972.1~~GHVT01039972.1.p1  ORF type:complete len:187 (-),score=45.23 GHVT01039972.1:536-1096(-)
MPPVGQGKESARGSHDAETPRDGPASNDASSTPSPGALFAVANVARVFALTRAGRRDPLWRTTWRSTCGKRIRKCFRVARLGEEEARRRAEEFQQVLLGSVADDDGQSSVAAREADGLGPATRPPGRRAGAAKNPKTSKGPQGKPREPRASNSKSCRVEKNPRRPRRSEAATKKEADFLRGPRTRE